jgi:DNA-binding IclR family transcriptional regulator
MSKGRVGRGDLLDRGLSRKAGKKVKIAMSDDEADDRKGVQSVEIGSRILNVLADEPGPAMLKTVAARMGISTSRAHSYLVSLIRARLVEQDQVTGLYELGPQTRKLGLVALSRLDVDRVTSQAVFQLHESTRATVALTVWTERGPTVVRWVRGDEPLTMNVNVGSVLPILTTAVGHIYMAYLPASLTQRFIDVELASMAKTRVVGSIRTIADVERTIKKVRQCGTASIVGSILPDASAIAAPIFDHHGQLTASLGLLGQKADLSIGLDQSLVQRLLEVTNEASARLGYQPA